MVEYIWVYAGVIGAFIVSILAFLVALYAQARVRKLTLAVYDLDWSSVGDLVVDVQKLKKQVQRYKNIENGEQASNTNRIIQDLEKQYYQKNNTVKNGLIGG